MLRARIKRINVSDEAKWVEWKKESGKPENNNAKSKQKQKLHRYLGEFLVHPVPVRVWMAVCLWYVSSCDIHEHFLNCLKYFVEA